MIRVLSLLVVGFLFVSTVEVFAGYWLLGRWFVSSRYASVSFAAVRNWLNRGIVSRATEWAKVFLRVNGKWIVLVLGLSQVIPEVERLLNNSSLCYVPIQRSFLLRAGFTTNHEFVIYYGLYQIPTSYYTASVLGNRCVNTDYIPAYPVYRYDGQRWLLHDNVPVPGTYRVGIERDTGRPCEVTISVNFSPCSFTVSNPIPSVVSGDPPRVDLSQRRRVPVRVFPNPADFVRPDVIANDPSLQWLRDEYQRVVNDPSIPTIPEDALGDLELPSVDWSIPEEEAVDSSATSSREFEGSQEGEGQVSVPGLDTKLDPVQRKPFPIELINQLVQNHPLLRILSSVSLDAAGGGSCVVGSEPFIIDMCGWQWVLNLMGSFLVPLAFLFGLGIGGRSEG
jgi:hypothetical protein